MAFTFEQLKDPGYFAENRIPARSDHHYFSSEEGLKRRDNDLIVSLNGLWKFAYARNDRQVPYGFEEEGFDCHCWESIAVPAHIQMEGYDIPQYVNQQYPWDGREAITIGQIPEGFNPVACYVKYFQLPETMEGKRVFLSFQGVESCVAVWLNGKYIGFSSNSFSPCEFELTEALKEGENKLACRVYKWHSGSWLEDQDFYRFSGIYRDVFLFAVPKVHLQDLKLENSLNEDYSGAELAISGKLLAETAWKAEVFLDGQQVQAVEGEGEEFAASIVIDAPRLWSAEEPNLYDVTLRFYDDEGQLQEIVAQKTGIRKFEMKDGIMCINGKRIVFRGVNRHDFTGDVGRAVTAEHIRRDLITMKRNNINAVRTSHYPNASYLYELCDELGLYVIAENNMETHGTWNLVLRGDEPVEFALPGDRADWEPMLMDRVNSTYQTSKNHPSIVIWSLGNESFGGTVILHMAEKFRQLDASRLVHYEGVFNDRRYSQGSSDMESQMYSSVKSIREFLSEHRDKPFICCEYSHAMGNSCGGMSLYTDLSDEDPLYQGGFIWDYSDQAIRSKDRYGRTCYHYGGDCGERPTDYAFSGNGICTADGRESVKMPEVKFNYQPVVLTVSGNQVKVFNRNLFLNTSVYDGMVVVERNGRRISSQSLKLDVEPLETKVFDLPVAVETEPGEYAVTVSLHLAEDTAWASKGHEIAFGQGVYQVEGRKVASAKTSRMKVVRGWYNTGVIGDDFRVLFTNLDGGLASYEYGGVEYMKAIPMPNFWRPMIDNDLGGQVHHRTAQWKIGSEFISSRQWGKGYWNNDYVPVVEEQEDTVSVTYTYHMPTSPSSFCKVTYTVHADGTVDCILHYEPDGNLPPMPEFGMIFKIDADYNQLEWYGLGSGESYADRKNGTRLGIWKNTVMDNVAQHLRPQESGNHMGVRWARVTDYRGRGLMFTGDQMNFSALPWTPHEIDCAQHRYELPEVHYTVIRPALAQMGVGGDDSWGSIPLPEYWVDFKEPVVFKFSFKGIVRDNKPY